MELENLAKKVEELGSLVKKMIDHGPNSKWISKSETLRMLGVSSRTLQTYRDFGKIGFTQLGRKTIMYKRADVEQLLEDNYVESFKEVKRNGRGE